MTGVPLPTPRPRPTPPQFEIRRVFADGSQSPIEVVPLLRAPLDVVAGRRGFLGAGMAVSAVTALLLSGCGHVEVPVDPCGDSAGMTPSPGIPRPPGGLAADTRSDTSVAIHWVACSDLHGHYEIERRTDVESWRQIDVTENTWFIDSGLERHQTYFYRVRAATMIGTSEYTGELRVGAVIATAPPDPPIRLRITMTTRDAVELRWDRSQTADSFDVERCEGVDCTEFTKIATTTTAFYTDVGRSPETTYRYRVRAVNPIGASRYSDIVSATTTDTVSGGGGGGGGGGCTCNQVCVCIPVLRGLVPPKR